MKWTLVLPFPLLWPESNGTPQWSEFEGDLENQRLSQKREHSSDALEGNGYAENAKR